MKPTITVEAVAYHEAGHAVVGWKFRNTLRSEGVFVDRDNVGAGLCDHLPVTKPYMALATFTHYRKQPEIWRHYTLAIHWEVMGLLAGPMAEKRFCKIRGSGLASGMDDTERARLYYGFLEAAKHGRQEPTRQDLHGDGIDLWLWLTQQRTARLLQSPSVWRAVQRLARELVRHGHVTAEKAERIIAGAGVRQISERAWIGPAVKPETISGSAATAARRAGRGYSPARPAANAGNRRHETATETDPRPSQRTS
jgi:hypothetical protein